MQISFLVQPDHAGRVPPLLAEMKIAITWNQSAPNVWRINGEPDQVSQVIFMLGRVGVYIKEFLYVKPSFVLEAEAYRPFTLGSPNIETSVHINGVAMPQFDGGAIGESIGDLMDAEEELRFILERAFFTSANGKDINGLLNEVYTFIDDFIDDPKSSSKGVGSRSYDLKHRLINFIKNKSNVHPDQRQGPAGRHSKQKG